MEFILFEQPDSAKITTQCASGEMLEYMAVVYFKVPFEDIFRIWTSSKNRKLEADIFLQDTALSTRPVWYGQLSVI